MESMIAPTQPSYNILYSTRTINFIAFVDFTVASKINSLKDLIHNER